MYASAFHVPWSSTESENCAVTRYYISITIVPSYTGKYHEFVAVVLLRVRSTSNNAEGDKRVICFRYSLVLW